MAEEPASPDSVSLRNSIDASLYACQQLRQEAGRLAAWGARAEMEGNYQRATAELTKARYEAELLKDWAVLDAVIRLQVDLFNEISHFREYRPKDAPPEMPRPSQQGAQGVPPLLLDQAYRCERGEADRLFGLQRYDQAMPLYERLEQRLRALCESSAGTAPEAHVQALGQELEAVQRAIESSRSWLAAREEKRRLQDEEMNRRRLQSELDSILNLSAPGREKAESMFEAGDFETPFSNFEIAMYDLQKARSAADSLQDRNARARVRAEQAAWKDAHDGWVRSREAAAERYRQEEQAERERLEAERTRQMEEEERRKREDEEARRKGEEEARRTELLAQARNYERAFRYPDAIKIFEQIGLPEEAKRVGLSEARELETARAFEEAAAIYEKLQLWDEAGRVRRASRGLGGAAPAQPAASLVEIARDYDHFQGYVRLKTAIRNATGSMINDVRFGLRYDEDSFRLDRVEPALTVRGNDVYFGNLSPNQRKTCSILLDPQICGNSPVEGVVSYKDASGELCIAPFRRVTVEVKCPLIFSPEQANTAMVKNLLQNELQNRDGKVYVYPVGMERSRVSALVKETILNFDVRSVAEVRREQDIEFWFFGQLKGTPESVVMRGSVCGEAIELFVAANSRTAITGLLAEMGHLFNQRMKEIGFRTVQITNVEIRDSILNRSDLLLSETKEPG